MTDGNTYAINKHLNDQEDWDALQEVTAELEQAEAETKKYHYAWLEAEAKVVELEAKLELIQQEWSMAVYGDLENGVSTLNYQAFSDFYSHYPLVSSFGVTLHNIIEGQDDE